MPEAAQGYTPLVSKVRRWLRQRAAPRSWKMRRYHWLLIGVLVSIAIFSYATNPFVRFSVVNDPYADTELQNGQFVLSFQDELILHDSRFYNRLALTKSGWHILTGKLSGGRKASDREADEIIADIHQLRFNPDEPFLISGDHFSVFYPRSLGIFYHSLMDPRIILSRQDWLDRQELYLKSTAYALKVFSQADHLSTTIVPVGPTSVALINVYAPPSDTLYSLLYALQSLSTSENIVERYPYGDPDISTASAKLQTGDAAALLLSTYRESLAQHWYDFQDRVYDDETGLVRKDILLSGVKDMSKHESAFYDNVMYWKTNQLAQELEIIETDGIYLKELKQRILGAFWNDADGYFLEDLSEKSLSNKYYSSDWIIAYQTGFLTPDNFDDLPYLQRSVEYVQRTGLDQPFGLHYHLDERPSQLHSVVRLFARDYGSTAIWCNLGQEYIKLLTHLYQVNGDEQLLNEAEKQLDAYAFNIKRYRGYPELYDSEGDFYRQGFYKSIRQTGWVISFEQARVMYEWTAASATQSAAQRPASVTAPAGIQPTALKAPLEPDLSR